jgi:hypothetical protein
MRIRTRTVVLEVLLALALWSGKAAHAYDIASVSIHGFVSPGYVKSTDNDFLGLPTKNGTFAFSDVGLTFSTEPVEKLRIGVQLLARDFGEEGNFDVTLDWAVGDYRWKDWLGIRAGKVKNPVGFYNRERDLDMLRTSIFLPQSIYTENMRDFMNAYLGGELYGVVPVASWGDFEYELFGGTIDADNAHILRDFITQNTLEYMPVEALITLSDLAVEVKYILGGVLRWNTPLDGLRVGGSFFRSESEMEGTLLASVLPVPDVPMLQYTIQYPVSVKYTVKYAGILSAEYTLGNLILAAEYFYQKSDIEVTPPQGLPDAPDLSGLKQTMEGFYVQARYRLFDRFEFGTYYSVYHPDAEDRDGSSLAARGKPDYYAWLRDWALSFRWDIKPFWLVKLEGHLMDGAALIEVPANPRDAERHWGLFAFKTTFYF